MWEDIKWFLNTLQNRQSIDDIADEILDFIQDVGLTDSIKYEVETSLYGIMDLTETPKDFIIKVGAMIHKKITANKVTFLEYGSQYYNNELIEDNDEESDIYGTEL